MAQQLADGDSVEVQGSSSTYTLSRNGNVYMCTCPAWRNQGAPIDRAHVQAPARVPRRRPRDRSAWARRRRRAPRRRGQRRRRPVAARRRRSAAVKKETAPPILLAHKWEVEHDPTGWWMSEKLDGIRAYWDGEAFVSRLGNRFFAPDWFVEDLPADTLDGELWVGRKMFQKTTSIVRSGAAGQDWKTVAYVVFDAPNAKGAFEDRIAHAQKVLDAGGRAARALRSITSTCDGLRSPARGARARRGARRRGPHAAPAGLEVRGRPLDVAAQGQDVPRRRGARRRSRAGRGQAQGPARRADRRARPTARGSTSAPASPTPSARRRRRSAR